MIVVMANNFLHQWMREFLEHMEIEKGGRARLFFQQAPEGTTLKILRDRAILEALFSADMRVSELCSLNRDQID